MTEHLFGCFPLDVLELGLLSFPEERVLEDKIVVLLLDLVEVIHVQLS